MMKIDKHDIMQNMKWIEGDGKVFVMYTHPKKDLGIEIQFNIKPESDTSTGTVYWEITFPVFKPQYDDPIFNEKANEEKFDVALQVGLSKSAEFVNSLVEERVQLAYQESERKKEYHKGIAYMTKTHESKHQSHGG